MHPSDHIRDNALPARRVRRAGGWPTWSALVLVAASVLASPSPGATEPRTPRDGGAPKSASAGRIQHVVIIDMENRSFDNVLGKFCMLVKDSQIAHDPCDGTDHGLLPEGQLIPLSQARDLMPDLNHSVPAQRIAIDGGRMDGFSLLHGCTADTDPPYSC